MLGLFLTLNFFLFLKSYTLDFDLDTVNNWIFVINDTINELKRRVAEKKWPIYHFTVYRKKIRAGDRVVFYKAGANGQKFLGSATTASSILKIENKLDFFVRLKEIEICKHSVPIHPLVKDLDFFENKSQWGRHLQGGVRPINKKDYETIVSKF